MQIPASWTFKTAEVAKGFDNHVREQLPWYDIATQAIAHIARHYIPQNGLVYDVGCATGNIGRTLAETLAAREARLIGIDPSDEMRKIYDAPGEFICSKAEDHMYEQFDLCILFLVLMFVEPGKRAAYMQSLYANCKPGGAIILFDKLEPSKGYLGTIMYRLTLAGKYQAGVNAQEIIDKELSLAGVQRPISLEQLPAVPFQWFKFGDFAGYILEKPA